MPRRPDMGAHGGAADGERGSALVLAIFVLVLLTGMGTALLFLSQTEVGMSRASVREKQAFYLAEAAVERARTQLWDNNTDGSFDDELATAATDGTIDFDPDLLAAIRDAGGDVASLSGFGDDLPVVDLSALANGSYAAFLTNDPVDIALGNPLDDTNERVMITGFGFAPDGSTESVQVIVERQDYLPSALPATITMLGPSPTFASSKSKVKVYNGEDCGGAGEPNLFMPVVGAVGATAIADAETGWETNPTYESGAWTDLDTFADLDNTAEPLVTQPIDQLWTDCDFLADMIDELCSIADLVCTNGSSCALPATTYPLVCVFDDFTVGPGSHEGLLVVTGELTMNGSASWSGLILAVGEGSYRTNGSGNGDISGGMVIADIAGPDDTYDTADDCTGPDGGFAAASFDENGGGNRTMQYCSTDLDAATPARPYSVVEFRQR